MANLPQIRRLLIEDFASQKKWISPLLLVLNSFMEAVVNALNKSLTLAANTTGDVRTVILAGTLPVSTTWSKPQTPTAVLVGNVQLVGGAAVSPSAAVWVQWAMSSDGKSLQVTSIFGVTPTTSNQYVLTLVCLTG